MKYSRSFGIDPPRLAVPPRRTRFLIFNQSGRRDLGVDISRTGAGRLRNFDAARARFRVRDTLDLTAGQYKIEIPGHPALTSSIEVR